MFFVSRAFFVSLSSTYFSSVGWSFRFLACHSLQLLEFRIGNYCGYEKLSRTNRWLIAVKISRLNRKKSNHKQKLLWAKPKQYFAFVSFPFNSFSFEKLQLAFFHLPVTLPLSSHDLSFNRLLTIYYYTLKNLLQFLLTFCFSTSLCSFRKCVTIAIFFENKFSHKLHLKSIYWEVYKHI